MSERRPSARIGSGRAAQSVVGNTARALDWDTATAAPAPKRRTPLSLVPAAARRKRTPFAVVCFAALVLGLASVLLLNISVSSGQYELVQLQSQQAELAQRNEALTQEIENHQAPQVLAAAAGELGMVSSPTFGTIDLMTLGVTGSPEAAKEADPAKALIGAPSVLTQPVAPAPSVVPEESRDTVRATEEQEETAPREQDTAPAAPTVVPQAPETVPEAELNGGTIPVPGQRSGN
ncbi:MULTISPECIES: hypothetical protein [unclassified Arthrobacter]|uniref:hypothetical protein n=1 Tax=unclassified Arthrobacter TaxID=235627 RepID=UPI001D13557D|nr:MULTISPECIES: hypothetical protein [unclassified Arthrobacter]MCC3274314.1 hypothetical protein [Arthrobacter sp. zg-Y20]MCC9178093.1 hypothetical protein [Arthrobacter sp. zg-Y750]MDK1314470.1 hypothetical protein [Arthrobacter sp. zg.Y20]MDK1327356.1 hypothetical protein [Arthrobacter sp. zg-Y1143]WIB07456.1 hypothetical protein QNO06_07045 [Arthrobacter sp. zg-Y20]